MAHEEQLQILKSGVKAWNSWRQDKKPQIDINLAGANLHNARLTGANLQGAVLNGANLSSADLRRANLRSTQLHGTDMKNADLAGANLSRSELHGAKLLYADLTGVDLQQVDLRHADLSHANLSHANLSGALFLYTVLCNTVLNSTIGLDSCRHGGPSFLDHRTLTRSGVLPLLFLRGCGLPDSLIEYLPSLLGEGPIQFYSCFISYSAQDQDFADRLHADLQSKSVRCWFAPHMIQGGKKIHEQIDEAIRLYDKLLLILSPSSMNSEWVKTEIAKARKRELRENRRMLFPLRLTDIETLRDWECFDSDTGKDSAKEIREYFIPDFSKWKTDHDAYAAALSRLLKDLKHQKGADAH